MSVIICCRCQRAVDLDFDLTPVCKSMLPQLEVDNEFDWVCEYCLTDKEAELLDGD